MIPHCAKNFQKILAVYISLSPPFSPQKAAISINKQKKQRSKDRRLVLALSIFPGRCQPSIVDRNELNYRVRNGNGWTLILISTNYMSSSTARKQTILYCFASYLSRPFSDLSYISIEKPASAFRDGKGKAAEGISFRACAEANDPQLALTW